jgi:all-trans-retinol dehydrogenase (NAD+)
MGLVVEVALFMRDTIVLLVTVFLSVFKALYRLVIPAEEKSLSGGVAVVTGAGHGIGREIAKQLAGMGVSVACWDKNADAAKEVAEEIRLVNGRAIAVTVDVSDKKAVEDAAVSTMRELGDVTLLINNAGIMPCKPLLSFTCSEVETQFSVNVLSHFWTVKQFLPRMIELKTGHIVAMSSVAGVNGAPNLTPYCSTKFAVKGLMDSLFLELRSVFPDSVPVKLTTVHPYVVTTGLAKDPSSRFMSLLPYTTPQQAAEQTLAAVRTNQEQVFIPSFLSPLYRMSKVWPREAQLLVLDYLKISFGVTQD